MDTIIANGMGIVGTLALIGLVTAIEKAADVFDNTKDDVVRAAIGIAIFVGIITALALVHNIIFLFSFEGNT